MSIQAYRDEQEWRILAASPMELVVALYQGAIQSVRTARTELAAGRRQARAASISRACAIIQELTVSLDRTSGGAVAESLAELYVYMHRRLGEAQIEQSDAPLAEVERLLGILQEAWKEVAAQSAQNSETAPLQLTA